MLFAGGILVLLVARRGDDASPSFSSGGQWLAFDSNQSGSYDLYLLNLHVLSVTRLTQTEFNAGQPHWKP